LLLVTIGLVVVGAVSLVIGFVQNSLPPIYISIVCSLLAAGVLVVFSRMSRRQAVTAPLGSDLGRPRGPTPAAPVRSPEVAEEVTVVPQPRRETLFPIADYDELRVAEILPLLEELDDEELQLVLDHERDDRDRATVVRRIDELLRPSVVVLGARGREDEASAQGASARGVQDEEEEFVFPIADYDELRIGEILPLLPELDDVELVMVREREAGGRNRASVLRGIADLLGEPAPASQAAPKRAPAKKAPAKKAAPTKTAAAKAGGAKAGGARKAAGKAAGAGKPASKSTKSASSSKATKATKSSRTPRKGG